ncbi:hypothetical protein [Corynebacterium frankenforstense]|uniref:hypothetical protein n=1 Tax=Corynebacterium frankenforstense TaxID=1230998 RepID=UPI0009514E7D|nr:hypothetical protein [Corynebacterium frankenforstense]
MTGWTGPGHGRRRTSGSPAFWIGWVVSAITLCPLVLVLRAVMGLGGWMLLMLLMFGLVGLPVLNLVLVGLLVLANRPWRTGDVRSPGRREACLAGVFFLAQLVALGFVPDFGDMPDPRCESGAVYPRMFYPAGCGFAETASHALVIGGAVAAVAAYAGLVICALRGSSRGGGGVGVGRGGVHGGPEKLPHQDSNLE